jgi:hypothetical protein
MSFWLGLALWLPGASEFWAAIIGSVVGGIITLLGTGVTSITSFLVQQHSNRTSAQQEWRRVQDEDLRAFQASVLSAMDSLETDLGQAHAIGLYHLSTHGWLPVASHQAIQDARMLATRIRDNEVREKWERMHAYIRESHRDLRVAMSAADPGNALVNLLPPEAQELAVVKAQEIFNNAIRQIPLVRVASEDLWSAFDRAYERLVASDSVYREKHPQPR